LRARHTHRESTDDGIFSMLILAPMISSAMLYSALQLSATPPTRVQLLPVTWRIEPPATVPGGTSALESLIVARRNLVNLSTVCAMHLIVHVLASYWHERRYRWSKTPNAPPTERASVPRREARRMRRYLLFSASVCAGMVAAKVYFTHRGWGIWQREFVSFILH
jgi:dolichol kinase